MMKKMRNAKKRKGFTLIELIVVIAILAILAAIAIPRFGGIRESANQKAVIANLKTLNSGIGVVAANENKEATAVTQADVVGAGKIVEAIPNGPEGVVYSIEDGAGEAQAKVPANAGIPGLKDNATLTLNDDGTLAGNE